MDSFVIPPDINGYKTIIPEAVIPKTINVALFDGEGAGIPGEEHVLSVLTPYPSIHVEKLAPSQIRSDTLSSFDVVIFSGGASHAQAHTLGDDGLEAVRIFIENGGGYLGICAGAHLAIAGSVWTLGILNAKKVVEDEWRRGKGFVDIELTEEGRNIFGDVQEIFKCRYANGVIITPLQDPALPPYTIGAYFRTEIADNDTTKGAMINTPAIVMSTYGKGRVMTISSHPENTPGLEHMIARAVVWVAQ